MNFEEAKLAAIKEIEAEPISCEIQKNWYDSFISMIQNMSEEYYHELVGMNYFSRTHMLNHSCAMRINKFYKK